MFSWIWLFFASLAVVGGMSYNLAVKVASEQINPFVFAVILSITAFVGHIVALYAYKAVSSNTQIFEFSNIGVIAAIIAGLGVVAVDLGFIFAVKHGGLALSYGFWVVGGLLLVTLASFFFFKESLDLYKIAGLVLGAASLVLLIKP